MSTIITTAIDDAVAELVPLVGKKAACTAVGLPRASFYRANPVTGPAARADAEPCPQSGAEPGVEPVARARQAQPRALSDVERATVLRTLHGERFADTAPASVYATLLDEGTYLCSESTMYRLLREHGEVRERNVSSRLRHLRSGGLYEGLL